MKRWSLLTFFALLFITSFGSTASAETLQDQLNNLVGPQQQYNTKLSSVYLRTNTTEETISPQSGNLTVDQTDYVLPGRNGLDLEFKRLYNSGSSNIQEMKVKYVDGAWVDYVQSDNDTLTFYENRYDLGIGMRFSFPTIEIKKNEDNTSHKFLHTDSGEVYRLRQYTLNGQLVYMPDGQTVQDVVVRETSEFSNGQAGGVSQFMMTNKEGRKTYFDADGVVLGIVDRYGNKIVFESTKLEYKINDKIITKKLISKITDTVGRVVTIEYKEDASYKVGKIENKTYNGDESYKNSQNPNSTDSGDLQEKFQVIVHLPNGQSLVYDKTAALVNDAKNVLRTRLQRVFDTDGKPKYHFWYEQPDLGFTYNNKEKYSAFNRYENLTQIDYVKTNRLTRYIYGSAKRGLNETGSMEYRKIFEKRELTKKGYNSAQPKFEDRFTAEVNDKINYSYTNEADGYGYTGYKKDDYNYIRDTYRYYTEMTDNKGGKTKYTYDGLNQLILTERTGSEHKEVVQSTMDDMKLVKKKETLLYDVEKGQAKSGPVRKIENYSYDQYGNLTNYTGPEAPRNQAGEPSDNEHTVVYTYDYDKFHKLIAKTWKQDRNLTVQELYKVDALGNVIQETKVNTNDTKQWVVINYAYDVYGNMIENTLQSDGQTFKTHYKYGLDADGRDVKGAYLTREYSDLEGQQVGSRYAYDFNTGNRTAEVDAKGNRVSYQFDLLNRLVMTTSPDGSQESYSYEQDGYTNLNIRNTDPEKNVFLYEYDPLGYEISESIRDGSGKWIVQAAYTYDSNHNITTETDANGHQFRYEYDSDNRIIKKSAYTKDGTFKGTLSVDYQIAAASDVPLLMTITDEEGYPKKYYYDSLDRLIRTDSTADRSTYVTASYEYDYTGNLIAQTDERKNTTRYQYDGLGRLISEADAMGNETTYKNNAQNQVSEKAEPGGKITRNLFDNLGRMQEERISAKGSDDYVYQAFEYDVNGNMTRMRKGQVTGNKDQVSSDTGFQYNSVDLLTDKSSKIDSGRSGYTHYAYDKNGNQISETQYADANRQKYRINTKAYDYAGRLTQETGRYVEVQADGSQKQFGSFENLYELDAAGNIVKQKQFNGQAYDTTTMVYDYQNQVVEKREPYGGKAEGEITRYGYDKLGQLLTETLSVQGTDIITAYTYDGLGNLVREIDPAGNTTKYVYDAVGNNIKEIDPRYTSMPEDQAPGTEFKYDALNQLVTTAVFDGQTRKVVSYTKYDARGNITLAVSGEGYNETDPENSAGDKTEYDVLDQPVKTVSAQTVLDNRINGTDAYTTMSSYDGDGNLLTETDATGAVTSHSYYLNGLPREITYPDGTRESYDYDLTGNAWEIKTDRNGGVTTTHNTIFDQPDQIDYPDGTKELLSYSSKGELIKRVDQAGNEQRYEYDAAGNVTAQLELVSSDASGKLFRRSETKYDEADRPIVTETFRYKEPAGSAENPVITSAGDKVTNTYDKAGRLTRSFGPNGRENMFEYDRAGNVVLKKSKVAEGNYDMVRYVYDVEDKVVSESQLVRLSDLAQDELASAAFDDTYIDRVLATTKYKYNKNGVMISQTDAKGHTVGLEYDLDSQLIRQTDPLNGVKVNRYDDLGRLAEEINENGVSKLYEYDSMNRLIRKKEPAADGSTATTRYLYDSMGNLVKMIDPNHYTASQDTAATAMNMTGIKYTYDVMNRRTSTISPEGQTIEYVAYDAVGRVKKVVDGLRYSGSMDASQGIVRQYDGLGQMTEQTDALGGNIKYQYDILGRPTQITDERGSVTVNEYNADGTLKREVQADGGVNSFTYDLAGRKISETDPRGGQTFYTYNSFGAIKTSADALGQTEEFKYDMAGKLLSGKDKRGSITLYQYDAKGQLTGKRMPLEKDSSGNILYAVESFTYDPAGNLLKDSITGTKDKAFLREQTYAYYPNGLVRLRSDNSGAVTENDYDKNGNLIRKETLRSANNRDIEKFSYDSSNRMIDWSKLIESYAIVMSALAGTTVDSGESSMVTLTASYQYDMLGNRIQEKDSRGNITEYSYNALNRVTKKTRKLEATDATETYVYDKAGNQVSMTSARGFVTKYDYNVMNQVITATDAEGNTLSYEYDLSGNKTAEINALGNRITYAYDKLNRLTTVTDPGGIIISRRLYDAGNNVIKDIDARGYLAGNSDDTRYGEINVYDLAGRLVSVTDREGFKSTYRYNPAGDLLEETDPLGQVYKYEYNNAGDLIQVIDPLGVVTQYSYDLTGNKLDMIDGRGKVTKYQYASFGLLTAMVNADNKTTGYLYDQAMNVAEMTDRNGNHTQYLYDRRNLLVDKKVVETGDQVRFTYDKTGNRLSMTDASGVTRYEYDKNDRKTRITRDDQLQIAYTYDAAGNMASVKDKKGNETVYTFDKSNRMKTAESGGNTTSYTYDAGGNRIAVLYEGGVKESYTFDKNNQLLTLKNTAPGGASLSSYVYSYDAAGRQSSKKDSYGTTVYTYDADGRIVKVEAPGMTTLYAYDKGGNRQSSHETYTSAQPSGYTDPSSGTAVDYLVKKSEYMYSGANVIQQLVERMMDADGKEVLKKTTDYNYDDNGNELRRQVSYVRDHTRDMKQATGANPNGDGLTNELNKLFEKNSNTFDGFNRLVKAEKIKEGVRSSVEFTYDGDGLRTRKVSSSSKNNQVEVTNYVYDRQYVILETDAADKVAARYIRGINYVGRVNAAEKLSYFLFNGHGDVVLTVDKSGTVENQYDYDIFGNSTLTVQQYNNAIRFGGEFYDAEVGLYYLRARYYDPYIGRFISEDTYAGKEKDPLSLNLYTYALNEPIMNWDPSGHFSISSLYKSATKAVTNTVKQAAASTVSTVKKAAASTVSTVKKAAVTVAASTQKAASTVKQAATAVVTTAKKKTAEVVEKVKKTTTVAVNTVKKATVAAVKKTTAAVTTAVKKTTAAVTTAAKKTTAAVTTAAKKTTAAVTTAAKKTAVAVVETAKKTKTVVASAGKQAAASAVSTVKKTAATVAAKTNNTVNAASKALTVVKGNLAAEGKKVAANVNTAAKAVQSFGAGAAHSIVSDNGFEGVANKLYGPTSSQAGKASYNSGKIVGHLVGLAQGAIELAAATTGEIGGGLLVLSGVGTVAGAPAIAAATAVGVHGVAVGANAGSNLLADIREMSAGKGSGGSSKSSEPSGSKSDGSGTSSSSWEPGMEVTEEHIRDAMKDAPLQTQQGAVSLPAINRYTKRLSNGEVPPPIKVDNNIIVDGNHRYISGRVSGVDIPTTPYSGGKPGSAVKWKDVKIDPFDWGNN